MLGEQRLVGGDDRLAGGERRFDRAAGRPFVAADQLDEEIDRRRARQRHRIVDPIVETEIEAARLVAVARAHPGDDDGPAGAARQRPLLAFEQADDGRPHRAETGDADTQGFGHGPLPQA